MPLASGVGHFYYTYHHSLDACSVSELTFIIGAIVGAPPPETTKAPPASAGAQLRAQLAAGPVVAAGCFDALSARLAEHVGFTALHVTGSGVEATQLGAPDMGLITQTEMVAHVARIAAAVDVPLICDVDTGFGGVENVMRTIRELERAGAGGVHIEDQHFPKQSPLVPGRRLLDRGPAVGRVRAAVAARRDPDFLIIARSDADAISFEEVVTRCNLYLRAGADVAFPMLIHHDGHPLHQCDRATRIKVHERLVKEIEGPVMVMSYATDMDDPSIADMAETGAAVVIAPTTSLHAATNAMLAALAELRATGAVREHFTKNPELLSQADVYELLGLTEHLRHQEEFGTAGPVVVDIPRNQSSPAEPIATFEGADS